MNIEQLKYIVEVADSNSITKSAKKLHISQPSISQAISKLEEYLQINIFERSRDGTFPTENGELIVKKAKEILFKIEELEQIKKRKDLNISGSISLVAIPSLCMTLLPKTLASYKSKYPNVRIEIIEGGSMEVKEQVLKGMVDIGLASSRNSTEYSDKLLFESLFTGKIMACVGKDTSLSKLKEVSLKEIINHPLVVFNEKYRMHTYILDHLNKYGEPNILLTTGNTEILKKVVIEGLAIGFYADIALKNDPYVYNGDIIPLHITEQIKDPESITHFGIFSNKNNYPSLACEKFIEELKTNGHHLNRLYNLQSI